MKKKKMLPMLWFYLPSHRQKLGMSNRKRTRQAYAKWKEVSLENIHGKPMPRNS